MLLNNESPEFYNPCISAAYLQQLDIRKTANFKGYNPLKSSNTDPNNDGDMHEGFEFGWEEIAPTAYDEKRANDGAMAGANVWPNDLPDFRENLLTY